MAVDSKGAAEHPTPGFLITSLEEALLSATERRRITQLLGECFEGYPDRPYYKQMPHRRWLAHEGGLVAQVGVDFRGMRLGERRLRVMGLIDLCVRETHRGRGIGRRLVEEVEAFARAAEADALLLFADDPRLYHTCGFVYAANPVRLLRLSEDRSVDVRTRRYREILMVKPLDAQAWDEEAELDLLGYLF